MTRAVPVYGWLGLVSIAVSEAGMLAQLEPFWSWHTPIAWTGYIMFVDGLVWKLRETSLLRDAPAEAAFLACVSVPLWVTFEMYNKYTLHNWHYAGLPENLVVRYIGYAWAFATICPAIFETSELIGAMRTHGERGMSTAPTPRVPLQAAGWISVVAGAVLLAIPIIHPSTWLAAPVWLGFIFLLDPINAALGDESIRVDLRQRRRDRLTNLLVGGLVCGIIWEFWNYWARTKWIYTVPVPPAIKVFEMPLAGYGGFPPFAVECFTMYVFARHLIWRGARRPIAL